MSEATERVGDPPPQPTTERGWYDFLKGIGDGIDWRTLFITALVGAAGAAVRYALSGGPAFSGQAPPGNGGEASGPQGQQRQGSQPPASESGPGVPASRSGQTSQAPPSGPDVPPYR